MTDQSGTIHILRGPDGSTGDVADDRETRWCFGCRKHLPHTWRLLFDTVPSYYDPVPVLRCSRCKDDRTVHPGVYRDGPAYPSESVWQALVVAYREERRAA